MTRVDPKRGADARTLWAMSLTNTRRIGVLAWPFAVGALLFAACGSDDDAAPSRSTIALNNGSTAFVVKEAATTTTVPGVNADGTATASQEYVVQAGDYPIKVADMFGVPLQDLVNFNGWSSEAEFPFPGATIKIPPGGTAPKTNGGNNNNNAGDTAPDTEPGDTIPDAGENCTAGKYTITADDTTRIGVADKFDVTVDALDAANAGTAGYAAFYPGLEIVIPAKADC